MWTCVTIVGFLALALGAMWMVVHIQYHRWEPVRWRERLAAHILTLQARLGELQSTHNPYAALSTQAAEALRIALRNVSVQRLTDFPGIGPGTLDRLRTAGFTNIAELLNITFTDIPGIGNIKAKELRNAVQQIVNEIENNGSLLGLVANDDRAKFLNHQREILAIQHAIHETTTLFDLVRNVGFDTYITTGGRLAGWSPIIMTMPLPEPKWEPAPTSSSTSPSASLPQPTANAPRAPSVVEKKSSPQVDKLSAVVRFAVLVGKADGRIVPTERKLIRDALADLFGHDPVLVRHLDPTLEHAVKSSLDEPTVLAELQRHTTPTELATYFALAEQIVDAAGARNAKEQELLARIQTTLGLVRESSESQHRRTLEIDAHVKLDVDLIRRRYNFHMDKLDLTKAAAKGEEMVRSVTEKRATVQLAAEALIAPFGEPLVKPTPPPPSDPRHNPDLDAAFGL